MHKKLFVEGLLGKTFKILNGFPSYITFEQKEKPTGLISEQDLTNLLDLCSKWGLERIGVSLERTAAEFDYLSELFLRNGFEHFSSRIEVYKDLTNLDKGETPFTYAALADQSYSESEFKSLWESCMSGSDNKPSSLTMDQHLMSVKSELGEDWEESCHVYYLQNNPIGISIPHLEPGTMDEGRLFYFGLIPEARGQGFSTALHLQSLLTLKEMGATYYIGSTEIANKKMKRVFEKNDCITRTQTESYYKYFSN
ncbi:GNAT family N-acetyltransferase [Neobacillus novalis]|uniref:GNAT family N-acetyltransferase n=1 Tax=Neobacillus novalis TaxID=220687 RepID=A0AA95MNK9_9BACI|nr:GNAT family N-acetyltransferase [Neobacillus novalis]WHY87292.1 GNAT family N-acetyltransferase [Neobacillus novalis]